VIPVVVGSSPISHPNFFDRFQRGSRPGVRRVVTAIDDERPDSAARAAIRPRPASRHAPGPLRNLCARAVMPRRPTFD
jgi:hypothetical protein